LEIEELIRYLKVIQRLRRHDLKAKGFISSFYRTFEVGLRERTRRSRLEQDEDLGSGVNGRLPTFLDT